MNIRKKIRKIAAVLLCAFIVGSAASVCSSSFPDSTITANAANYYRWEDFLYSLNSNGTISIIQYMGDDEFVYIPDKIYDHTVTVLGESSFADKTDIIKVTMPDTITTIELYAFAGCKSLKEITIPAVVKSIDPGAFGIRSEEKIYLNKIYGKSGSPAEAFAKKLSITFVGSQDKEISPVSVKLNRTSLSLEKDKTETLVATVFPNNATNKNITWSTTDSSIVSVSKGVVKAVSPGTALIMATTSNGLSASCRVTVKSPGIPVKSITLSKSSISIGKGETYTLKTSITPSNAEPKTIRWLTSDKNIVSVSGGKIKGVNNGSATITAWSPDGARSICRVTVKNAPGSFKLSKGAISLGVGENYSLSAIIPDGTASALRSFRSSNSKIVKMTNTYWTGSFAAAGIGTAYVTAKLYNGKEAACRINVMAAPSEVNVSQRTMNLKFGTKGKLSSIVPSGSASSVRTFRTSNSKIIKMTKTNWTGEFIAVGEGTAWVTVRTYNGKEASCRITVGKAVSKIELFTKKRVMKPGQTMNIRYHIPQGESAGTLSYSSGNTKICTVNQSGVVKAVGLGTAIVTVSAINGKKAACIIVVTNDPSKLASDGANKLPLFNNFKTVCQNPELPTGCETAALTSVLNFKGYNVDKCTIADKYLDKGPLFKTDFNVAFVGDPRDPYSYGCYAPVIVKAANKFLTEKKSTLSARKLEGYRFEELFNFTDTGTPVLVWTSSDLVQGRYTDSWETSSGKKVTWYSNEHCVVLLGTRGDNVYVGDPEYGTVKAYNKALFKKRYQEMFSQAVVIQ